MGIRFTLDKTLNEVDITRNKLAVEAKIRPATIADIVHGKTKRLEIDTLINLLETLQKLVNDKGLDRRITIEDILVFESTKKES